MTDQGERYDRIAGGYLRCWAPVLVESAVATLDLVQADVTAGARRILDLGTGSGTLGIAAVRRWPVMEVVGIDASSEMVAVAEREADARLDPAQRRRFSTVATYADDLPFLGGSFDLVVSSFVLQLVPSRVQTLREVRRVLRPGGRIAYVTWLADDRPFAGDVVFDAVLAEAGIGAREPGGGNRDLASPSAAAAGLRRAGFVRATARAGELVHRFDADGYAGFLVEFDEEDLFESLPADEPERVVALLRARLATLPAQDLVLRVPIVYATGTVPSLVPKRANREPSRG